MVRILLIFSRSIYRSGLIFSLSKYLVPCDFKFDTRDRFDISNPLKFSLTLGRLKPVTKSPTPADTLKASPINRIGPKCMSFTKGTQKEKEVFTMGGKDLEND